MDGPSTFQTDSPLFAAFGPGQVTIPAATEPVPHTLVATQVLGPEDDFHIRDVPARAAIAVSAGPGHSPVLGEALTPVRRTHPAASSNRPAVTAKPGLVRVTVSKVPD